VPGGLGSSNPGNTNGIATNNTLRIEFGGSVTQCSKIAITASNTLQLLGGVLEAGTVSNYGGVVEAYGVLDGGIVISSNGLLKTRNALAALSVSNSFVIATDGTWQVELGTSYFPVSATVTGNLAIASNTEYIVDGTIDIVNSGGMTAQTYTLVNYSLIDFVTPILSNSFHVSATIGTAPSGFTYTISTNTPGQINLVVSVAGGPQITSIAREGNNVRLGWTGTVGKTNVVQVSTSKTNFTTNYVDLSGNIVLTGTSTNYLDVGGATNSPARYYRIRQP